MMLLEHHAKELLGTKRVPGARGHLGNVGALWRRHLCASPLSLKHRFLWAGRGKAGGIVSVETEAGLDAALARVMGMTIKGHKVRACRIETPVDFAAECYLSLSVDADAGGIRVMMSADGGIDIENQALRENVLTRVVAADLVMSMPRSPRWRRACRLICVRHWPKPVTPLRVSSLRSKHCLSKSIRCSCARTVVGSPAMPSS